MVWRDYVGGEMSSLGLKLACVASVSVWFRSEERPVLATREMTRAPFFAQSLTLVPRSLLLNRKETLAA